MGGATEIPGNSSAVAEANIWHDPEAAQLVVDAPWDLLLVGLEATMRTQFQVEQVAALEQAEDPRARFMSTIVDFYTGSYQPVYGYRTFVLHDALAVALTLEPDLAEYELATAEVELRGSATRGQVVVDRRRFLARPTDPRAPGVVRIVSGLDVVGFQHRFLQACGVDTTDLS